MTLYSACRFNNEVTLILRKNPIEWDDLWTEKQDFIEYKNIDYSDYVKKLNLKIEYLEKEYPEIAKLNAPDIHTSDLLAWYILGNKGGTVSDMDILFFKPVPKIEHDIGLVKFKRYPMANYIPVSFMQGRPCSFFRNVFYTALECYDPKVYESCGSVVLEKYKGYLGIGSSSRQLPSRIVFPFAEDHEWKHYRKMMFEDDVPLPEECIGIHWYAGANQDYNNLITNHNFKQMNCTITNVIRKVLTT